MAALWGMLPEGLGPPAAFFSWAYGVASSGEIQASVE